MKSLEVVVTVLGIGLVSACAGTERTSIDEMTAEGNGNKTVIKEPVPTGFDGLGSNPSPTSDNTNQTLSDEYGKTFRAYYAERVYQSGQNTDYKPFGIVDLKVLDANTVELTSRRGTKSVFDLQSTRPTRAATHYTYEDRATGNKQLTIIRNGSGFMRGNFQDFLPPDAELRSELFFNYGFVTDPSRLPIPNATYFGRGSAFRTVAGDFSAAPSLRGLTRLVADFASNRIFGDVLDASTLQLTMSNGLIKGSQISAQDSLSVRIKEQSATSWTDVSAHTGQLAGQFSGLNGEKVHGAFGGTFTVPTSVASTANFAYSGGDTIEYRGVFDANKQ